MPTLVATNPGAGAFAGVRYVRALVEELRFLVALIRAAASADVIHVLGASWFYFIAKVVPSVVLGRLLRRRVVVNYRGGQAREFLARHGRGVRFVLRRADALTVPSPFLARVLAEWGLHADVVPNIAELERFAFRPRGTLRPRMLVSRTLAPIYNVALAIDAFSRIRQARPDATLTVAAAGPLESDLRAQVARFGLEGVAFLGSVDHAAMPARLRRPRHLSQSDRCRQHADLVARVPGRRPADRLDQRRRHPGSADRWRARSARAAQTTLRRWPRPCCRCSTIRRLPHRWPTGARQHVVQFQWAVGLASPAAGLSALRPTFLQHVIEDVGQFSAEMAPIESLEALGVADRRAERPAPPQCPQPDQPLRDILRAHADP